MKVIRKTEIDTNAFMVGDWRKQGFYDQKRQIN